jgi:soluble lytic murein transglycosylase-like protein
MKRIYLIGVFLSGGCLWAGESVMLTSGFTLRADRHELSGDKVLLYSAGAVTEIPASLVAGFEVDEVVTPPAQPVPPQQPVPPERPIDNSPEHLAEQAARKFALPESFIKSVMRAESGFQPTAVSPKGAIGLMQLMPDTARYLGVDARDPEQNAEGGARYLRELLERYQNEPDQVYRALAAYNAGPAAVEKYHGVPPYQETREYILRVLKNWDQASTGNSGNNASKLSY